MMDRQYRENGARNTHSSYNQMKACVECSPNEPQKIYLIDPSIEQLTKLEDSGMVLVVSVFQFYQSIAVQL